MRVYLKERGKCFHITSYKEKAKEIAKKMNILTINLVTAGCKDFYEDMTCTTKNVMGKRGLQTLMPLLSGWKSDGLNSVKSTRLMTSSTVTRQRYFSEPFLTEVMFLVKQNQAEGRPPRSA